MSKTVVTQTSAMTSRSSSESLAKSATSIIAPSSFTDTRDATTSANTILSHSLAMTDLIFGIYAVGLWHYDETTGKLVNVSLAPQDEETGQNRGCLLVKRMTQEADPTNDYSTDDAVNAYAQLTDPSRSNYIPLNSTDPGVGLAGVLWTESSPAGGGGHGHGGGGLLGKFGGGGHNNKGDDLDGSVRSLTGRSKLTKRGSLAGLHVPGAGNLHFHQHQQDGIEWRDVGELANDPDQPYDERLQAFSRAGFKLATAIPFDINGYRGIVVYFANPHCDPLKLGNPANSSFMKSAAQMIGAAAAIEGPMNAAKAFREEVSYQNWHRMKMKVLTVIHFGGTLRRAEKGHNDNANDAPPKLKRSGSSFAQFREASAQFRGDAKATLNEAKNTLKSRLARWTKKIQGGSAGIPPAFTTHQCLWTFMGVMITHTILSRINQLIKTESDGELSLILAPLGALTTLQYNLTAAPASQPRNAIFAQIFALTTAILLSYIPNIEPWFRSALAPAIVIPGMAKLGIIHPPAGAAAIVFSSGKVRWEHFGIFMAGVAISIITSVFINNMSDKRQYPTSWYLVNKAKRTLSKD